MARYLVVFPVVNERGNIAIGTKGCLSVKQVVRFLEANSHRPNVVLPLCAGVKGEGECPTLDKALSKIKAKGPWPAIGWVTSQC